MPVSAARFTSSHPDYPITPKKQTFDGDTQNVTQRDDASVIIKGYRIFILKRHQEALNSPVIHTSDLVKIENRSRKRGHKLGGIVVEESERFHFLPIPLTTVAYDQVTSLSGATLKHGMAQ